jgi:HD-GYP domain-containing protein (c-di-GMP phosphodiesterase class II)
MNEQNSQGQPNGDAGCGVHEGGLPASLPGADLLEVLTVVLDVVDEPVFVLDREYRLRIVNHAAVDLLGLPAGDIAGRHCYELVHGAERPLDGCPNAALLVDGRAHETVITEPRLGGECTVRCRPLAGDGVLATVHVIARLSGPAEPAEEARRLRCRLAETVRAMGEAAEFRDPYTAHHQRRVTALAQAMALQMGLDESAREGLTFACQVHDIAKIGVPADILAKPGPLSDSEMAIVRAHVEGGARLVSGISFEQAVREIVLQHHERLDGSGYPRALRAEDLLLEARILAVADVVEAMASDRPYRRPLGIEAALAEVREGAGIRYDPDAVAACLQVIAAGFQFPD